MHLPQQVPRTRYATMELSSAPEPAGIMEFQLQPPAAT